MRTIAQLEEAAHGTGMKLVDARYGKHGIVIAQWDDMGDAWAPARMLVRLAVSDAKEPAIQRMGDSIRDFSWTYFDRAQSVHWFVKERVRFQREDVETFQSPVWTMDLDGLNVGRFGDCDCMYLCVASLAIAAGLTQRARFLEEQGVPSHVWAEIGMYYPSTFPSPRVGNERLEWLAAETSVDARFGEHPKAAARRLGVGRVDLGGAKESVLVSGERVEVGNEELSVWPTVRAGMLRA
jgi:hypothetical protein